MKQFGSYETAVAPKPMPKLPVGNYILKIMDAEEVEFRNGGSALKVSFDIAEGEFKDFFAQNYRAQIGEDKRWKGTLIMYVPKEDGSEQDGWTANAFKGNIVAIEESNLGYHWDWNEKGLKGKKVGGVFFEKEWEFDGKTGFATTCHSFKSIDLVKSGTLKTPKPKLLKNRPADINVKPDPADFDISGFEEISTDDGELPF